MSIFVTFGLLAAGCATNATSTDPRATSATAIPSTSPVAADFSQGRNVAGMNSGVPNPPRWYEAAFGRRTQEKVLYLTFDDGPAPGVTDEVLDILAQYGAKATFFVVGEQALTHPHYVSRIANAGHAIGNHTMTHPDLISLPSPEVRNQLADTTSAIGKPAGSCMRPPYGLIDTKVARVSLSQGLVPILWTGHAQDWDPPPVDRMVEMLQEATQPGAVILLHDGPGKERTVAALRSVMPWWVKQGYTFAAVPPCSELTNRR